MSQLIPKAIAFEEKSKWKNAADTYLTAAKTFLESGNSIEAKKAFLKAIENAEKTEISTFIIDLIFEYERIATDKEKKEIFSKAIKPINNILDDLTAKEDYPKAIEFLSKKEIIDKAINLNPEETQHKKGQFLQNYALSLLTSKKVEEKNKGFEALNEASTILDKINKKEDRIKGEFKAFKLLMDEGFVKEGLKIFNDTISYCKANKLVLNAEEFINQIINYANDILNGRGLKKQIKAFEEILKEKDPGNKLLEIGYEKSNELNSTNMIRAISKIQFDYANTLFIKKKYIIAKEYYNKALQLLIQITEKEASTNLTNSIIQNAYSLLDIKGNFDIGLEFFSILDQIEKIDLDLLGDIYKQKAENMFTRNKIDIALNDYLKSTNAYLEGNFENKFTKNLDVFFDKIAILISKNDFNFATKYIDSILGILQDIEAYEIIGLNLAKISTKLVKANRIKEAENYIIIAVENLLKIEKTIEAAEAHQAFGESLILLEIFDTASLHLIEAAKLYKNTHLENRIIETFTPILLVAKNKLKENDIKLAQALLLSAVNCAQQKDLLTENKIIEDFADYALQINKSEMAIEYYKQCLSGYGNKYPKETKKISQKMIAAGKTIIISNHSFDLGKQFFELGVNSLANIKENVEAADILLETSQLLFDNKQNELARELMLQITKIVNSEIMPDIFCEKVLIAAKKNFDYDFIDNGIDLLRKVIGVYVNMGQIEPVNELALYCEEKAKKALEDKDVIHAKHLFMTAMEISLLINLELHDEILNNATNMFLEINDYYTVKELHDYAKNNLEGEKDYLGKLGRLIIIQGAQLREQKELMDESSEFIRTGLKILNQAGMYAEAGEAALAQGNLFIIKGHFIFGVELIETSAQNFIKIKDITRSGDAFYSLAEVNILRESWQDAFRQIELANKSYLTSKNYPKLSLALLKTAEIGHKSLIADTKTNRALALECFEKATKIAKDVKLYDMEIDIYREESKAFIDIRDYQTAYNIFLQIVDLLEKLDEKEKSPSIAEELSNYSSLFISENEIQIGIHIIDLSTSIYLRLEKPISASEVYMKSCNTLLKKNKIGEGVKLVLLASDTLMVANEFNQAAKILDEVMEFLFGINDYQNASIVIGQIVTVHQKTGKINEQKKAITHLVGKAEEVIKKGKIIDGEQLWEQASNYSVSVNISFAIEIYNARIKSLLAAGMYNSTNNAYKQLLAIIGDDEKELLILGDHITNIIEELYNKGELGIAKNFILTAIEYYRESNNNDKARNICLIMSQKFIQSGDELNGIDLIDQAATIANETEGAHEAAKIYLTAGFVLLETNHIDNSKLSIKKAIDIEIQTKNTLGCIELGDIAQKRAVELANSDIEKANELYIQTAKIFDSAGAYIKAGEVCNTISNSYLSLGKVKEAADLTRDAINFYLKGKNVEFAITTLKQIIDYTRRFIDENELIKVVHLLERSKLIVEKINRPELLSLIINNYLYASNQYLPNRKSGIGIFFLNRAIELAKTSKNKDEIKKVIELAIQLSLDIIKKKNSIAGAKVLEIVSNLDTAKKVMTNQIAECYLEALKLTIDVEWNMIGKITRDGMKFFEQTGRIEKMTQMIDILTKRVNADILLNKPQIGFFFLEQAIKISRDMENVDLLILIGNDCIQQLQALEVDTNLEIKYKILGYCYDIFQKMRNIDFIERVGKEFVKLGSKDLISNMQSIRGYEALITSKDIAIQTQSETLMSTVILALLDFAKQSSTTNAMTTLSTLEDIVDGLKGYQVPNSSKVTIDYTIIQEYIKSLLIFGDKTSKSEQDYSTGKKIIELCNRILTLSKNESVIDKEISEVQEDLQKYLKKANRDAAYKLKHTALLLSDLNNRNDAITIAENSFKLAQMLFERKKYDDSLDFLETALKINDNLAITTELKNIGLFSLSAGDRLVNEGKIPDSMIYYDIATEAFDLANDDENSSRLVNKIFQTREWDADVTVSFKCYKIATESAIRLKNRQKAMEIANKCYNRGIAFIDQPRIPINLSLKFITLAGKVMEDIGAIKEAANTYDNAILKLTRLLKTRKNLEINVIELLNKSAINRMANCDMDSLETIFLRVNEIAEMKKEKEMKIIAKTLKLINASKVDEAWNTIVTIPFVSHGRIRKVIDATKNRIIYDLNNKGTFNRTIFSTTDRSLPLAEYIIENLHISRKIDGQQINKDVFISLEKMQTIRNHFYSEFETWGRIELGAISNQFSINLSDIISTIRREFLSNLYMALFDNEQRIFYSFDRLKAEISLIINRERKKASTFDPMQVANEMRIPPDIIKEVLRELSCEEEVEIVLKL